MAINLTDRITAKTVENILVDSRDLFYQEESENLNPSVSANTVAHHLNEIHTKILGNVNLGTEVGDPHNTWKQGNTEEYINTRIAILNN